MATSLAELAETGVPGWKLRSVPDSSGSVHRTTRTYAAAPVAGGPQIEFSVHSVLGQPVRACYPFGAHDLAVSIVVPASGEGSAIQLLQGLTPALFAAHPRCRRVIAAPDEDDTATQLLLEKAGFLRATEADLPHGSVVLYAVEPPSLAELSTALDDMPH